MAAIQFGITNTAFNAGTMLEARSTTLSASLARSMQAQLAAEITLSRGRISTTTTTTTTTTQSISVQLAHRSDSLNQKRKIHCATRSPKAGSKCGTKANSGPNATTNKETSTKMASETLDLGRSRSENSATEGCFSQQLAKRSNSLARNRKIHLSGRSKAPKSISSSFGASSTKVKMSKIDIANEAKFAKKVLRQNRICAFKSRFFCFKGGNPNKDKMEKNGKKNCNTENMIGHNGSMGAEIDEMSESNTRVFLYVREQAELQTQGDVLDRHMETILGASFTAKQTPAHNSGSNRVNDANTSTAAGAPYNNASKIVTNRPIMPHESASCSGSEYNEEWASKLEAKLLELVRKELSWSEKIKRGHNRMQDWVAKKMGMGPRMK